jgi:hypothetical protein
MGKKTLKTKYSHPQSILEPLGQSSAHGQNQPEKSRQPSSREYEEEVLALAGLMTYDIDDYEAHIVDFLFDRSQTEERGE